MATTISQLFNLAFTLALDSFCQFRNSNRTLLSFSCSIGCFPLLYHQICFRKIYLTNKQHVLWRLCKLMLSYLYSNVRVRKRVGKMCAAKNNFNNHTLQVNFPLKLTILNIQVFIFFPRRGYQSCHSRRNRAGCVDGCCFDDGERRIHPNWSNCTGRILRMGRHPKNCQLILNKSLDNYNVVVKVILKLNIKLRYLNN